MVMQTTGRHCLRPLNHARPLARQYNPENASMIIVVCAEKGGVGKTTLAVNLATQRALEGHDVLLVDTDLQVSSSLWAQKRDEATIQPRVACVQKFGKGLQAEVRDLARRYEDIVLDVGAVSLSNYVLA